MVDIAELDALTRRSKSFPELGNSFLNEVAMSATTAAQTSYDTLMGCRRTPDALALEAAGLGSMDTLLKQVGGLSSPFGASVRGQIEAMEQASAAANLARFSGFSTSPMNALAEELREASRFSALDPANGQFLELPEPYIPPPMPPMPPNPILETNELLEELSAEFAEIKTVVAATAVIQERQAELIDKLLAAQIEGAASQEKAGRQALRFALWSLLIAIASIVVGFIS